MLPYEARLIAKYQEVVETAGYRWQEETFFTNHDTQDAMVYITQDPGITEVAKTQNSVGWGRFSRMEAWTQAADFVQTWKTVEAYRQAGQPFKRSWERWEDVL